MVWVKNNEIHLTKGDTARFKIDMARFYNNASTPYTMVEGDKLIFSMRTENIVSLSKEFNTNTITINPNDTKKLAPGLYKYEVELHHDGDVFTVVAWANFHLEKEVL